MREKLRFLGLDVHAETIAVAVAEPDGEVRSLGTIANREDSIRKFIRKLGSPEHHSACYEAGPTGFVLYWQLTQLGGRLFNEFLDEFGQNLPTDAIQVHSVCVKMPAVHCGNFVRTLAEDQNTESIAIHREKLKGIKG